MTAALRPDPREVDDRPVVHLDASARMHRVPTLVLVAVIAALPLVVDPAGWFVYLPARWTALAVACAALAMCGLVGGIPVRRSELSYSWAVLAGVAVASALLSGVPIVSMLGTGDRAMGAGTWILHGLLALAAATCVHRPRQLAVLARALSVGVLAVAAVTLAQRGGWQVPAGAVNQLRPGGPLGNADFLGAYGVIGVLVSAGLVLDRDQPRAWRHVAASAALLGTAVVVLSGARASWLALVLGGTVLAAWAARTGRVERWRLGAAGVAAVGFCIALVVAGSLSHRLDDLASGTAAGRVDTWRATAGAIAERPGLGWGPEGLAVGLGEHVDDAWERDHGRRLTPDRAHNGLLDVAGSLGLVGLAAYLWVLVSAARGVRRAVGARAPFRDEHRPVVVATAIALGAHLVQQQALFQLPDVDAIAWILAGALCGSAVARTGSLGEVVHHRRRVPAALATVITVALVLGGIGAVRADRHARNAADQLAVAPQQALDQARRAIAISPGQTLPALLASDAAERLGSPTALAGAIDDLRATRNGGFDDGRLTLAEARLLLQSHRIDGDGTHLLHAAALLDRLVADQPARSEAWLLRGQALAAIDAGAGAGAAPGEEALASMARAVELRPRWVAATEAITAVLLRRGEAELALDAIERLVTARGGDAASLPTELLVRRAELRSAG